MEKTKTNVETKTRYVIGPGGVRMTYEEWLDMVMSERN